MRIRTREWEWEWQLSSDSTASIHGVANQPTKEMLMKDTKAEADGGRSEAGVVEVVFSICTQGYILSNKIV